LYLFLSLFSCSFHLFSTFLLPYQICLFLTSSPDFPCGRCVQCTGNRRLHTRRVSPCSNFSDPFFAFERSVNIQHFDERCALGRPWVDPWSLRIQCQALPHMQPALRSTAPVITSRVRIVLLLNLQAPCVLYMGQGFRYSLEKAFYVFNQQIYLIV